MKIKFAWTPRQETKDTSHVVDWDVLPRKGDVVRLRVLHETPAYHDDQYAWMAVDFLVDRVLIPEVPSAAQVGVIEINLIYTGPK